MKRMLLIWMLAVLSACAAPTFVADAPVVPATGKTPDYFELPARFAVLRMVYGSPQQAGAKEAEIWQDLAEKYQAIGHFSPLVQASNQLRRTETDSLIETARKQRYNYLFVVSMHPGEGTADITLYHVGSGGLMATATAADPNGGRNGFWGGYINNPKRLERRTLSIARATVPQMEAMLKGIAKRQR